MESPKQKYKGSKILSSDINNKTLTQVIWLAMVNWPASGKDPNIDTLKVWYIVGMDSLINSAK